MPPRRRIPMMTCHQNPFRSLSRRRICLARRSLATSHAGAVSRVPQVDSAIWRGRAVAFVERDQEILIVLAIFAAVGCVCHRMVYSASESSTADTAAEQTESAQRPAPST